MFKKGNKISLGRKISDETRKKLSLAHKGRRLSEDAKKKISLKNKGHIGSKYWLGKKRTGADKKKMSRGHIKNPTKFWLGKKLPDEVKRKISDSLIGKFSGNKNFNWRGGITPKNNKIRSSIEYKFWRKTVFGRDNFTCQKCQKRGGDLIGHHINNFAGFPELRFEIDNGCTLCKDCHKEFHKKYGKKNNTREQLEEFLC